MTDHDKALIDRLLERHDELLRNIDALSRDNARLREFVRGSSLSTPPPGGNPPPTKRKRRGTDGA